MGGVAKTRRTLGAPASARKKKRQGGDAADICLVYGASPLRPGETDVWEPAKGTRE